MSDQAAAPSYEKDIQPLFRDQDRARMEWAFDLWSYEDVKNNAPAILDGVAARLREVQDRVEREQAGGS